MDIAVTGFAVRAPILCIGTCLLCAVGHGCGGRVVLLQPSTLDTESSTEMCPNQLRPLEQAALLAINEQRHQRALRVLDCNSSLVAVARRHGEDMCQRGYFAHVGPDGTDLGARLVAQGIQHSSAGEVLARRSADAATVVAGWLDSAEHRQNLLGRRWSWVGVAWLACSGANLWVGVFVEPD